MSDNTMDKDMAHFPNREDRDHKMDEIHKAFDDIRKNIDSIITMIDEILLQEEDFMSSDREAYCMDCLSLDEQEFLMHGNQRLEP